MSASSNSVIGDLPDKAAGNGEKQRQPSSSSGQRLQIPGIFALSPSNKTGSSVFSTSPSSPTVSPRKVPLPSAIPSLLISTSSKDLSPTVSHSSSTGAGNNGGNLTPTVSTPTSQSSFSSSSARRQELLLHHSHMHHPPGSQGNASNTQPQQPQPVKLKNLVHRRVAAVKMDDSTISLKDFTSGVTLGTGTFGRVQLIRQIKGKQNYFALKTMKKTDIIRLKQVDHIMSEALLLKELAHPFIVNLCATFQDSKRLYLILEFVPGGELFSFLRREKKISDEASRFYAAEIVLALDYLHGKDIAYRDLKPENLLLSRSGHLKITDFGFAKKLTAGRTWTLCGTPEYLAPEIIQSRGHGKSVDWWALGILIYEMLAGYPPFYEENPLGIYQKILRGHIEWPAFFDSRARELISKLLKLDMTQRLGCLRNGAEDVANEPWFAKVNWQSVLDRFVPAPFFPPVGHPGDSSNFDEYDEEEEETDEVAAADQEEEKGEKATNPLKSFGGSAVSSLGINVKAEDNARFTNFGPVKDLADRKLFLANKEKPTLPDSTNMAKSNGINSAEPKFLF